MPTKCIGCCDPLTMYVPSSFKPKGRFITCQWIGHLLKFLVSRIVILWMKCSSATYVARNFHRLSLENLRHLKPSQLSLVAKLTVNIPLINALEKMYYDLFENVSGKWVCKDEILLNKLLSSLSSFLIQSLFDRLSESVNEQQSLVPYAFKHLLHIPEYSFEKLPAPQLETLLNHSPDMKFDIFSACIQQSRKTDEETQALQEFVTQLFSSLVKEKPMIENLKIPELIRKILQNPPKTLTATFAVHNIDVLAPRLPLHQLLQLLPTQSVQPAAIPYVEAIFGACGRASKDPTWTKSAEKSFASLDSALLNDLYARCSSYRPTRALIPALEPLEAEETKEKMASEQLSDAQLGQDFLRGLCPLSP
ncbi:MAG: hypothetical protein H0X51_03445 [Parachlamydiaceae bacterium]|nr:hypothetical protein [Parachlamydiaceae bacterium]